MLRDGIDSRRVIGEQILAGLGQVVPLRGHDLLVALAVLTQQIPCLEGHGLPVLGNGHQALSDAQRKLLLAHHHAFTQVHVTTSWPHRSLAALLDKED